MDDFDAETPTNFDLTRGQASSPVRSLYVVARLQLLKHRYSAELVNVRVGDLANGVNDLRALSLWEKRRVFICYIPV